MSTIIMIATFLVIGCFVYFRIIRPMMGANMSGLSTEASKEYQENKEAILNDYFSDVERFGLFKQVIPDENIIGIINYAEPRSISRNLSEELKTTVTNVRKVNMDLFYAVITDKNLHCIEFNGKNSVNHQVFDLNEIQGLRFSKSGGLNVKDHMSGTGSGLNKMRFHCNGGDFEFNLFDTMYGFPKFTVKEDKIANRFDHVFCMPLSGIEAASTKEFYVDSYIKHDLATNFKTEIQNRFRVTF